MSERILVAGGAGFIGRHLCRALAEQGHRVFCLDNFSTSDPSMKHELESIGVEIDEVDVTLAIDRPYDAIYHLASPASPVHYRRMSLSTMWANTLGTRRLVELANAGGSRFLLASTSEVYGDPNIHPQAEEYWGNVNPIGERACYDESKRFAETITWEYRRVYGLNARIVRIFNTYGPGMMPNDGRVIPEFIRSCIKGLPIRIHGSGLQTRSFCYVYDLVRALILVGQDLKSNGHVYNIGSPDEITIQELATLIRRLTSSESEITYSEADSDDPRQRQPNIDRIRAAYGWNPSTPLMPGLIATIDDLTNRIQPTPELIDLPHIPPPLQEEPT